MKKLFLIFLIFMVVASCSSFIRSKDACKSCGGTGKDTYMTSQYEVYTRVCPVCAGIGKEIK